MKYLELIKGLFTAEHEARAKQLEPYVAYSEEAGGVMYTFIPAPVVGPADNEIWYTTTDGEVIPNWTYYDPETTGYPGDLIGEIISNSYENGIGKITCKNVITVVAGNAGMMESNFSENLRSIMLPNSVTSIGDYAFSYCPSLTSITIPNSVTSIGGSAFMDCSSLGSITIPNSVTEIQGNAFSDCSSLASIAIPNSVTSIGNDAFRGCLFTKDNFINNSSLDAEANNYWGATIYDYKMDGVFVKDNVAIKGDKDATSIIIPDDVTSIVDYAFSYCSLTSITIPNSVTSIGSGAFGGCDNLTSINIPNSVTSIEYSTFANCSSLTSVTIPESVTSIGGEAFRNCSGLTSITIGNGVTSIGSSAFSGCSSLTSVTIPNSVTSIGYYAFNGCSGLTSVTIPNSVTSIEDYIFNNCTSLVSITFEGTKEEWNAIDKSYYHWADYRDEYEGYDFPATVVHCTDGDVAFPSIY